MTRAVRRPRRRAVRDGLRADRPRVHPGGGRDDQAAGEHLPLGQHRAGQRAGDPLRADGHRHLGGRRRRLDQALRVHALRAGAGDGRPLPAGRSVLSDLARARVSHVDRVHRARRQDQPADALPLRASGSSARSTTSPSRSRAPRSRSSASATRAASATSASPRRCGSWRCSPSRGAQISLPRSPTFPRCPISGCRASRSSRPSRDADAVVLVTAHPGIDHWRIAHERLRCSSTCAASPAAATPRTSSGSSRVPTSVLRRRVPFLRCDHADTRAASPT